MVVQPHLNLMCGGKASPNPDYPQDIHVVTGDNVVKVVGKNLFNIETFLANATDVSKNGSAYTFSTASAMYNTTIPLEIAFNERITISYKIKNVTGANYRMRFVYEDGYIADTSGSGTGTSEVSISNSSAPLSEHGKVVGFRGNWTTAGSFTITDLMVNIGTAADTFEPYNAQTQLISLGSIELAKIGDYTDKIFKAVSSNNPLKPSYYDTLPSEVKASLTSGVWYKQAYYGKKVLNGTETVTSGNTSVSGHYRYYIEIAGIRKATSTTETPNILCTHYKAQILGSLGSWGAYQGISIDNGSEKIVINDDTIYGQDTTAYKTWLTNNNVTVWYPLSTPTITEITDTTLIGQLENILKMRTIRNTTNGWIEPSGTNAQAGLTLTYRQDLATLIAG